MAIDAGASKTVAVLAEANGAELARVRGAGAHVGLLGAGVWDVILPTAAAALAEVGAALVPEQLHCCLAIAGGEHVAALAAARAASPRFGCLQIISDGLAALSGCLGATEAGVMVAAGTGTVAWARSRHGEITKAGGHGFPAGDEGGGAWIGLQLIRHTLRRADAAGLDPLADAVLDRFGRDIARLHAWLTIASPADYATLAPIAFDLAVSSGSASAILRSAASELVHLAERADPSGELPLIVTGGLAAPLRPWLDETTRRPIRTTADAVIRGALSFARGADVPIGAPALLSGCTSITGRIVTPAGVVTGELRFRRSIEEVRPGPVDEDAPLILPGFVDLQVNGGGGHDIMVGDPDAVRDTGRFHRTRGVTTWLPTVITEAADELERVTRSVAAARADRRPGEPDMAGLHLEGPFISAKRRGTHGPHTAAPSWDLVSRLHAIVPLRVLTLAAELPGAIRLTTLAREAGIRVQLGHSDATYDEAVAFFAAGGSGVTHLYNAMSPLQGREPGVVGAALAHAPSAQIIADFIHVHPGALRAALRTIPDLFCVSDAVAAAGMPDGDYSLGGIHIRKQGDRVSNTAGALAGSAVPLDVAWHNLRALGLTVADATRRVSTLPAQYLGLTDRGALQSGLRADIVVMDDAGAVNRVYVEGEEDHGPATISPGRHASITPTPAASRPPPCCQHRSRHPPDPAPRPRRRP
ncbi:BadF/BadG/BcrA/BcrD ATPase family protein [Methylobacterium nonmethylotrophicum]|uniref:BadF/BadG/BcrA/BcrD ATPase family protein n=1 Tax=Methylobacterium nonmethylotrophicum TaxID=1141884 RepID=UPI001436A33E|nr:BadF/BadG/BcrA/BcrD ATPase family protein [Methylobacterium nonmethylotrophicum]